MIPDGDLDLPGREVQIVVVRIAGSHVTHG